MGPRSLPQRGTTRRRRPPLARACAAFCAGIVQALCGRDAHHGRPSLVACRGGRARHLAA
eukprot:4319487-Prymnesium_polylepis.1